jgi:hypothetical protein
MLKKERGFASALARSLNEREIHLILDLIDLDWAVKTPVSFLDAAGVKRLREILLSNADDPAFEKQFLSALKKPSIDQVRLFEKYQMKGQDRGQVIQIARGLLLDEPELAETPRELESRVEEIVKKRFGRTITARVVNRYLSATLPPRRKEHNYS